MSTATESGLGQPGLLKKVAVTQGLEPLLVDFPSALTGNTIGSRAIGVQTSTPMQAFQVAA